MTKKCEIEIVYCNNTCPHFYHKYEDYENIWCNKLDQKVSDAEEYDMVLFDYKKRLIPNICPLEDIRR